MKNKILKSSFHEKLKMLLVLLGVFLGSINQVKAGTPNMSSFGIQFRDDGGAWFKTGTKDNCSNGVMDCDFGSKTNLKIVYIYANGNKNGGNLCGDNYFKYEIYGPTGTANWGGTKRGSCSWSGNTPTYKWGTENSSTAWIDLVQNRKPGDYRMEFYMSFDGNTSSDGCGGWYDCKYNNGNWKFSWTIPEPTITITGASSLVVGTSTNIKATITNYPVGATVTKVRVTGNIASAKETTGSASNLTVSSVVPNASGSNGIIVTVTVTYGTAGTKDYTYKYNVSPPAVSDFSVSEANHLAGDGTTSEKAYVLPYNGTLSLSLAGSQAATDANSAAQYYNTSSSNAWSTTSTKSISGVTSTTATSTTVKMRYKNSSTASLVGTESSKTIYYKSETRYNVKAVASPAAGGTVTPTTNTLMGQYSGGTITASENTGYTFTGWTGGTGTYIDASETTTTFKPTAASTVTANFSENMSTVSLVASPSGKGTFTVGGSTVTSTTVGIATTREVTAVPISGYRFTGWSITGGASVSSTSDNPTTITGGGEGTAATLTATFEEDLHYYDVTFGVGAGYTSYGSLSAKVTSTSAAITSGDDLLSGTGITFTATPNAGYEVAGFYSDAACTSSLQSGTSTTYTIVSLSADVDVYVKFQPITYTITWSPSSAPTGCTYTTKPTTGTYGNTVTMVITPSTGYTVSVSAVDASSNTVTLTKSTNTYTFTQPASAVTVSVSTTEVKSTVTVTTATTSQGTLKFGSTSKSWGETASVGVATSLSITATAASGFKFVRWDLSGAAATASSTTSATIMLKADGSGNTGTATAVFAEDLSSPYIVTGGNKIVTTGTTWRTTADAYNKMLKKTGHSTESVAYFYVNIDATNTGSSNSNYQFKIYKTTATTGYYGLNADGDSWWYKRTSGEQTMASPGKNIELRADVEGSYEIKIDYTTPASPKITISYPSAGNYAATLAVNGHGTVSYEGSGAGSINLHGNATSISATPEPGYRFVNWTVDGAHSSYISFENANSASTTVRATSASAAGATITANFTNDGFVYFDRSAVSGVWSGSDVYMTCLNSSDLTWDGSTGTLVVKNWVHEDVHNKKMSRIPNTNIYYYDCTGHLPSKILFTDKSHAGDNYKLWQMAAVVEWANVDLSKDNMFVVENYVWQSKNYTGYFEGYWMKYNETSSGIQLLMWTYGDAVVSGTPVTFTTTNAGDREFTANVTLSATTGYKFKVKGLNGKEYGNSGTMTNTNCTGWDFLDRTNSDCNFTSTGAGTYKFTLNCTNSGKLKVSLEFPLDQDDYRVVYYGKIKTTAGSKTDHASNFIRHLSTAGTKKDIVSFYVTGSDWTLRLQKCTSLNPLTWTDQGSAISAATFGSPAQGVHNFEVKQVHTGTKNTVTITYIEPYKGNYYIRTDVASGGWEAFKTTPDNKMEYSDYSKEHSGYDYYHCHWTPTGKNVRFCVANDYSQNVSETMTTGDSPFNWENLPYQANVRFMYNSNTNVIGRAYLNGSSEGGNATFLWLQGSTGANKRILRLDGSDFPSDTARFGDDGNWIYRRDLKAEEGARIKLISNYYYSNTNHYQYFKGTSAAWSDASTEQILGGDAPTTAHTIRIIYDFKTNHLVSAWLVDNETVSTAKAINTSVMVVREHQGDAKQLTFSGSGKLTAVDTVYCVMQFNKTTLNNSSLSIYERALYWISFPFDVKLNDVFGFGTYGEHWIMEYYDGKGRAANGFWAESDVNWKYIMPSEKKDYVLKAYEGYVLALDLDNLTTSSSVWNYVDKVSLYFPSAKSVGSIVTKDTTITIDQTGYECTIDRTKDPTTGASTGLPANYDRTKRDSYWHCIGVPSFANNAHSYTTGYIKDLTDDYYYPDAWTADNLPFYYAWNSSTNALSPQRTGSSTTFKAMNSYLVQYSKTTMAWTSTIVSPKPSSVIARQKVADEEIHSIEFNIHLLSGEKDIDHTYVRLTDDEEVTSGFEFGHDLTKAFNAGANIYTIVEQVEVAGNSLPLEYEKTTIVPLGVKIVADGEYTFSMPEGTNGVGVTLIDNETDTRTNLGLTDYSVTLTTGDHNNRFVLEISPIEHTTTAIENSEKTDAPNNVCKKLIDGVLYIIKDGKVFDARGARLQ